MTATRKTPKYLFTINSYRDSSGYNLLNIRIWKPTSSDLETLEKGYVYSTSSDSVNVHFQSNADSPSEWYGTHIEPSNNGNLQFISNAVSLLRPLSSEYGRIEAQELVNNLTAKNGIRVEYDPRMGYYYTQSGAPQLNAYKDDNESLGQEYFHAKVLALSEESAVYHIDQEYRKVILESTWRDQFSEYAAWMAAGKPIKKIFPFTWSHWTLPDYRTADEILSCFDRQEAEERERAKIKSYTDTR